MPRVLRKPKRRRPTDYTEHHIRHLLRGHDFFCKGFGRDVEAMEEGWRVLREELLPKWRYEHPGSMPWAWWRFDAPERRRRIDGKLHPFDNPARIAEIDRVANLPGTRADYREKMYRLCRGKPSALFVLDDFLAEYESEKDYPS